MTLVWSACLVTPWRGGGGSKGYTWAWQGCECLGMARLREWAGVVFLSGGERDTCVECVCVRAGLGVARALAGSPWECRAAQHARPGNSLALPADMAPNSSPCCGVVASLFHAEPLRHTYGCYVTLAVTGRV